MRSRLLAGRGRTYASCHEAAGLTTSPIIVASDLSGVGGEVSDEAMGRALAALEHHGATGATGAGRYDFTMTVEATTPARARAAAVRAVERARAAAGLPDWPVAGVDVLQAEGAVPTLVGIPEIARMLSVHPERVRELVATHEQFPGRPARPGEDLDRGIRAPVGRGLAPQARPAPQGGHQIA